ncbi:MAG: APC family permease [Atopobiaceae bacterium]|jgi:APA family basic amino acid/polyamine antiporter
MKDSDNRHLKKSLSMISMISIAAGAVIGGWLAEAPYWFSLTGPGSALIFIALAILMIPIGLTFSEMVAMLPFSSSVAGWTSNATNHRLGWIVQWLMFLVQIVEPPLCAFILTTALGFFIEFTQTQVMIIAIGMCFIWFIVSNFNVSVSGKLSTIFFFAMIIISLCVSTLFLTSPHWSVENLVGSGGWFPRGGYGVFLASGVLTLKYIGFEMTPTLVEETTFPVSKMWKVILAALLIPALLYAFVIIAMGGMAPWEEIAAMQMPEPEIIERLGLPIVFAWAALISGSLHGFTTFMGFWTSSARVLYGSAQLNMLPPQFHKLNKYGQPYVANTVVLIFTILFCIFSASNWVQYIYAVSCIAAGLVYAVVCFDALRLRKLHPDWERPYKAHGGAALFIVGFAVSIWIVVASSMSLDLMGWISFIAYMCIGIVIMLLMEHLRKKHPGQYDPVVLTPDNIGKESSEILD